MLTTTQFVSDFVDALIAQGVAITSSATLKTTLKTKFDGWLDAPDAVPANLAQRLTTAVGQFQAEVLQRYDFWNGTTTSGPHGDGTYDLTLPDGTVVALPCLAKLVQVTAKGDAGGVAFIFSTTTTDADPGAGKLRFDNATIASVAHLFVDNLEAGGADVTAWLDSFDDSTTATPKGVLYLAESGSPHFAAFKVTGAVVDGTGYRKIPVTYLGGVLPANNARVSMAFAATGGLGGSFLYGTGAPGSGVGADGDAYLNITTGDFYGPKAAGAWGSSTASGLTGFVQTAKDWAQKTGATVDGTDYSAKEHAVGAAVATGSAKDWATKTSGEVVAGEGYGAKKYAQDAQNARDTINGGVVFKGDATTDATALLYFIDALNRELGLVLPDASWDIVLSVIKDKAGTSLFTYETNDPDIGQLCIVDANMRVLWAAGETTGGVAGALAAAATADAKAVAAQTTASTALANAATADGKAVTADAKATTALAAAGSTSLTSTNDDSALLYFVDAIGRILGQVNPDGGWQIALAQLAASDGVKLYSYESNDPDLGSLVVTDATGRILWSSASPDANLATALAALQLEVTTARGTQASLDGRLSKTLTAYGAPKVSTWGREFMRNTHQRLTSRALSEASQLVFAAIGDSYTQNPARWTGPYATTAIGKYGDAGGGWCGFGYFGPDVTGAAQPTGLNGNPRLATYPVTFFGAAGGGWIVSYNNAKSPDLSLVTSVTTGDRISVGAPAAPVHNAARLFFVGTANGVIQYRFNGGAWTALNVQGTVGGLQYADLAGLPAAAFTLDLETVSGTVKLCGVDLKSAASGMRFHKLGGSGSNIAQWITQSANADWQAAIAALGVNAFVICDGTNSQGANMTPAAWKANLGTLIDRLRASAAFPDILVLMPPENQRTTNTYPMSAYAAAGLEAAIEKSVAFRDLQADFGLVPADYASTSTYPLFNVDGIHPEPLTGGRVMVQAVAGVTFPF